MAEAQAPPPTKDVLTPLSKNVSSSSNSTPKKKLSKTKQVAIQKKQEKKSAKSPHF
ncbi:hypothetical protein LINPERHAP2_LOCUS13522 [Linum perenne]